MKQRRTIFFIAFTALFIGGTAGLGGDPTQATQKKAKDDELQKERDKRRTEALEKLRAELEEAARRAQEVAARRAQEEAFRRLEQERELARIRNEADWNRRAMEKYQRSLPSFWDRIPNVQYPNSTQPLIAGNDLPTDAAKRFKEFDSRAQEIQKKADDEIKAHRAKLIDDLQALQNSYTKEAKLDEAVAIRDLIRELKTQQLARLLTKDLGKLSAKDLKPGQTVTIALPSAKGGLSTEAMTLAWIPAGSFMRGSAAGEDGRKADEGQHKVTLTKGFFMGIYPVTQAQWSAVMGANPSHFKGDNLPVDSVDWSECGLFCQKLSAVHGMQFYYPYEAEWEYACRAGTTTPFHSGTTISPDQANFDESKISGVRKKGTGRGKTTPVGSFAPNAWGLYDMHGNVSQWCWDWYGPYPKTDLVDPTGHSSPANNDSVLRGGNWNAGPEDCRSAARWQQPLPTRSNSVGFRVKFYLTQPATYFYSY